MRLRRCRGVVTMHKSVSQILRFFEYGHLPEHLADVSGRFRSLALWLVEHDELDGPELMVALRKLLEAKDAAVRSALPTPDEELVDPGDVEPDLVVADRVQCSRCKGSGRVADWRNWNRERDEPYPRPCPACRGRGYLATT